MKYVFYFCLYYFKFKKNAKLKIWLDDNLIDEITLQDNILPKVYDLKYTGKYRENSEIKTYTWIGQHCVPEKIFWYEIDESQFRQDSKFTFEIENDDNNYTNGFMTKWGKITFDQIVLVPKQMMTVDFINRANSKISRDYMRSNKKGLGTHAHNIIGTHLRSWPNAELTQQSELFDGGCVKIHRKNKNENKLLICKEHIGGSFSFDLPVFKKFKIYYIKNNKPRVGLSDINIFFDLTVRLLEQKKLTKVTSLDINSMKTIKKTPIRDELSFDENFDQYILNFPVTLQKIFNK